MIYDSDGSDLSLETSILNGCQIYDSDILDI